MSVAGWHPCDELLWITHGLHTDVGIHLCSHNYWIASGQQGSPVSICALCSWQQALSSGMLTPVVSWSSLVRFPSAFCCIQCSNHSSAWGPGVQQWCTHYGFLHQPEVSVANGLLYAISIFCLSKVWKSHICCNYGA